MNDVLKIMKKLNISPITIQHNLKIGHKIVFSHFFFLALHVHFIGTLQKYPPVITSSLRF